eukprot:c4564_g1_i1.p3 GENE.c4564_g1_i1~~c4564_g1_i1.p3  ORF type:complete len:116 (-),score=27.26 c4564_g1_i1:330-677(-)
MYTTTFGAAYYPDRYHKSKFTAITRTGIKHIDKVRLQSIQKSLKSAKGEKLTAVLNARLATAQQFKDMFKTPQVLDEALVRLEEMLDRLEAQLASSGGHGCSGPATRWRIFTLAA